MSTATIESTPKIAWRKQRGTTAEFDALLADGHPCGGSKTFALGR